MRAVLAGLVCCLCLTTTGMAKPARHVAHPAQVTLYEQTLARIRADYLHLKADKFASAMSTNTGAGKPFKVTMSFADTAKAASYQYADGVLLLALSEVDSSKDAAQSVSVLVSRNRISHDRYAGVNGFGAQVPVESGTSLQDGLAVISAPPVMSAPPAVGEIEANGIVYWTTINSAGPSAKAIVNDTDVIIEGTMRLLATGKLAGCSDRFDLASFDHPQEWYWQTCYVGADITKISFTRRSTGQVLRQWVSGAG
jgi:hypothetical protein